VHTAPTAAPSQDGSGAFSPGNAAEERLIQLARDSIELLPAGRWPELYDQFTREFQDRCTREEFTQGKGAAPRRNQPLGFVRPTTRDRWRHATGTSSARCADSRVHSRSHAIEDGAQLRRPPAPAARL
jgi:hypothetical protein